MNIEVIYKYVSMILNYIYITPLIEYLHNSKVI